jgi:exonuclease SbcC
MHLSAAELKEKILEILGFNEPPNPKAQSVIYRYAIFTPQEEMKEILSKDADERLQTLRKALHIEDYQLARDNSEILAGYLKAQSGNLKASASDVEDKRSSLKAVEDLITSDTETLGRRTMAEQKLQDKVEDVNGRLEDLRAQKEVLIRVGAMIPQLQKQLSDKLKEKEDAKVDCDDASKKLQPIEDEIHHRQEPKKPTEKSELQLTEELESLKLAHAGFEELTHAIDSKLHNYERVLNNRVCPICDRPAEPLEFQEKITAEALEKEKIDKKVTASREAITTTEHLLRDLTEYHHSQEILQGILKQAAMLQDRKTSAVAREQQLSTEINELSNRLKEAQDESANLKAVSEKLGKLESERDDVDAKLKSIGKEISEIEAGLRLRNQMKEDLKREIEAKQNRISKANTLDEYTIWLKGYFAPTLENIEKHVMVSFQQEFNQLFQQWFGLLVEDATKEARIDEEFTPIVEQDGYEHDVQYLSGGEKTSIALAYRLALNMMVRKVSTSMQSNLLILDEPTDGFSREQLLKVRDILEEVACPQVIIVSHEKELESFANQIFRVSKEQGVSTIEEV